MIKIIVLVAVIFLLLPLNLLAAEYLYPDGANISISQSVNDSILSIYDTLTISRIITNNETQSLNGLYLTEIIPDGFELAEYQIEINGQDISCNLELTSGQIYTGYSRYCWIIDDPNSLISNNINPGDSLSLTIHLVNTEPGSYSLPLRTTAFYTAEAEYFSYRDSIIINIITPPDIIPPNQIFDLSVN